MYVSSANCIDHTYYKVQNNLQQMKLELLYFFELIAKLISLKTCFILLYNYNVLQGRHIYAFPTFLGNSNLLPFVTCVNAHALTEFRPKRQITIDLRTRKFYTRLGDFLFSHLWMSPVSIVWQKLYGFLKNLNVHSLDIPLSLFNPFWPMKTKQIILKAKPLLIYSFFNYVQI